jgi:AraC family L-rhamnose operon regulatory protein RhaS
MADYMKSRIIHIPSPRERGTYHNGSEKLRYELPFHPAFSNLVYIDRLHNEKWFTPMQVHDYFELCYVAEGSGWFILDGVKHSAQQGQLFVTKPHEVHCGGASGEGAYTLYSMGFEFKGWNELEKDFFVLGPSRVVEDSEMAIPDWCERLIRECETEAPYAATKAKAFLTALLTDILRCYASRASMEPSAGSTIPPFIKQALANIHMSSRQDIDVSELAHETGVSRSHLDREFKKLLGVSLGEYIRHLRLDTAMQELRQTDSSITEISDRLGFDSVQAFCMFFKRHSGTTPQAYRINEEKR